MTSDAAGSRGPYTLGYHGIRYQIKDVQRAVDFYTTRLGFKLEQHQLPAFATVSLDGFKLLLLKDEASMPNAEVRMQKQGFARCALASPPSPWRKRKVRPYER